MILFHHKPVITSHYGMRNGQFHPGVDTIPAGSGFYPGISEHNKVLQIDKRLNTPVIAVGDGKVVFHGVLSGAGLTMVIDYDNYRFVYAHLSIGKKPSIIAGDAVKRNDVIGFMGCSGLASSEHTHLHLTIIENPKSDNNFFYDENVINPLKVYGEIFNSSEGVYEVVEL